MLSVSCCVEVAAPAVLVYQYLGTRYECHSHRHAWLATRGYESTITCMAMQRTRDAIGRCGSREVARHTSR